MRFVVLTIYSMILILLSSIASADVVENLYETRVKLEDQSVRSQTRGFSRSMRQVLQKVTGGAEVLKHSDIRQSLRNARDFIIAYRFESAQEGVAMLCDFDADKINQMVSQAGFPVWGKRRPSTLVWLATQPTEGKRFIVSANDAIEENSIVLEQANQRGIPVIFPLMDLQEAAQLSVFDVWGRFDEVMRQASDRYATEFIISARLYPSTSDIVDPQTKEDSASEKWQLDWQFIQDELGQQGILFSDTKENILTRFSQMLADHLAGLYATQSSSLNNRSQLTLKIMNMNSIEAYVELINFFNSLEMVSSVSLLNLTGSVGEFELTLLGASDDFLIALDLDEKISQKKDAFGRVLDVMEFQWK
ncbi:MAG: DUF2066 domain-containing protein [Alteromonadaceae bacterium]|nr:DUF2066 domain-containing protein [Alteromonadaceae bacterium]